MPTGSRRTVSRAILAVALGVVMTLVLPVWSAGAATKAVRNGGFEAGLTGWTTSTQTPFGTDAGWFATHGNTGPISGLPLQPAPEGLFQAVVDQDAPGSNILYQDIVVPSDSSRLEFALWYINYAPTFFTPRTLSAEPSRPNQQLRIDLVDPFASPRSLATRDVLQTVFLTNRGQPLFLSTTRISADITGFGGELVRLRIAEVDNQSNFTVGIDAVRVFDAATGAPAVALTPGTVPPAQTTGPYQR